LFTQSVSLYQCAIDICFKQSVSCAEIVFQRFAEPSEE